MKSFFTLLFLVTSLHAAPFNQSTTLPGVAADATLTQADAKVVQGNLVITLKSAGANITEWIHVFSDTGDSAAVYEHSSGKAAGKGLKMLFEGNVVYRFNGASANIWSWNPIADTAVIRTTKNNTMTLTVPIAHLGFVPGTPVHFFVAAYSPDYADTLDTLPRGNDSWSFTLPKR